MVKVLKAFFKKLHAGKFDQCGLYPKWYLIDMPCEWLLNVVIPR